MCFLICEALDWFGKCFIHLWGFIIFSRSIFLSLMSCLQYNSILPMRYYLCTLLFIIIQWKDTLQYSYLHSCDSISFLLSIFHVYSSESYLSSKIYFMCFFLASRIYLLIALKLLFLHGIRATWITTLQSSTWYHIIFVWYQSYREHNLAIFYMIS